MEQPYLSVVIPAFQEERRIAETLRVTVDFLRRQRWSYELLVVDDGSSDATADTVRHFQQTNDVPQLRVVQHPANRGKGAAVQTGMRVAQGRFSLFADADNATPIDELSKLLHAVERGADVAIGSRYLKGSTIVGGRSAVRQLMSRLGNILFRFLLGLPYSDTRCGFKIFTTKARTAVFSRQTLMRWGFDTELLLIARRQGLRVEEVPVRWYDRERGHIHPVRDTLRSLSELFHMLRLLQRGEYDQ